MPNGHSIARRQEVRSPPVGDTVLPQTVAYSVGFKL